MKSSKSTSSIILAATITTWASHIIQIISGLVVLPILVLHLGKTHYGIWVLIGQTINFLVLSDLGVASAIGRSTARLRLASDKEGINQLYSTALLLLMTAAIIIAAVTFILSSWIPDILKIEEPYHAAAILTFIITGISLALQYPFKIGIGILTGHQLYGPHGMGKTIGSIFQLVGFLLLFIFNLVTLISVALMSAASMLFTQVLLTLIAWKMTRPWDLKMQYISLPIARELLSVGGSSLVVTLSNLGYRSGIGIAVGRMLGVETAGIYGVAVAVMNHLQPLISSLSTPFLTLASEWHASNQIERLRRVSNFIMRITFALAVCLAVGLYMYGEPVLHLLLSSSDWTATDFKMAGNTLSIMGIGLAIGLPQIVSRSTLQGVGKHWQVGYAFITISVLSLASGVAAIEAGLDLYGAALGWGLFWVFQGTIFYPVMICRYLGQSLWNMIVSAYAPGMIVGGAMFVLAWQLNRLQSANNSTNLIVEMSIYALSCVVALLIISGQQKMLLNRIMKMMS